MNTHRLFGFIFMMILVNTTNLFAGNANIPVGVDTSIIDYRVDPGDDFYTYASGRWLEGATVPNGTGAFGYLHIADSINSEDLIHLMDGSTQGELLPHLSELVCGLYTSGMDTSRIEALGFSALAGEMRRVDAMENKASLPRVLARLQLIGVDPFFHIYTPKEPWDMGEWYFLYLKQSWLGLSYKHRYSSPSQTEGLMREKYADFIIKMLTMAGVGGESASSQAQTILALETRLAEKAMTWEDARTFTKTYNRYRANDLNRLIQDFDWTAYLRDLGVPDTSTVIVGQPDYFKEIGNVFRDYTLDDLKMYLCWVLVYRSAYFLSEDFRSAFLEFREDIDGWRSDIPRQVLVLDVVRRELSDPLDALYIENCFSDEKREHVETIIRNLRESLRRRILSCDLLSDGVRKSFITKLDGMKFLIGGPGDIPDYSTLTIEGNSYVENVFAVREHAKRQYLRRFGSRVLRTDWTVPAHSLGFWYSPTQNVVTIAAGGINMFYCPEDDAWNHATLGWAIGHEMSHGFDKTARNYDETGEYKSWWTKAKEWFSSPYRGFDKRIQKLERLFRSFVVLDTLYVDGERTLNENTADLSGLTIALDAYLFSVSDHGPRSQLGFTGVQRFFLAYAQRWREVFTEEGLLERLGGYHSPPRYRTNGVLCNVPLFYEAFNVDSTAAMHTPVDDRIRIW